VRKRLSWVVRATLSIPGLAEYQHRTRACVIDFISPSDEFDAEYLIGMYACTLVHEATHGVICSREIPYSSELRLRIERLCVTEEQRFLLHLTITRPELSERLYTEFDASRWRESWNKTEGQRVLARLRRSFFAR